MVIPRLCSGLALNWLCFGFVLGKSVGGEGGLYQLGKMGKKKPGKKSINLRKFS